ncbi:MAG TPA: urate oxidase [Actinomycetota bacterium]|nr:urate oxidase [Actinomycetota bacterium]
MNAEMAANRYGKAGIHVATVVRRADHHDFVDRLVDVRLEGDFAAVHTEGDNAPVLPTDTMRGTVFALSKEHPDEEVEAFALRYTEHLLGASPSASLAEAWITERPWDRVVIDGTPHPHAFTLGSYRRTAHVVRTRDSVRLSAGLEGLSVLKTTGSGFSGFLRDRFTTLPETDDRILATQVRAEWRYAATDLDFAAERERVKDAIVHTFARHDESRSVQHTLWEMGRAVLEVSPSVEEVSFSLPNLHHILADLSPYGMTNEGEVFLVTDSPSGQIEGTVRRSDAPPR